MSSSTKNLIKNEENTANAVLSQMYSCIDYQWNELTNGEGFVSPTDMKEDDIRNDNWIYL